MARPSVWIRRTSAAFALGSLALALSGCNLAIIAGIVVGASAGSSKTRSTTYRVPTPKFTSITPASGSHAGGTLVTVVGADFDASTVLVLGGDVATNVKLLSSTELTALTPPSTTLGPTTVTVADPQNGSSTDSNTFTYTVGVPTVTIAAIPSPQSGSFVVPFTVVQLEGDPVDLTVELDSGSGFQSVPASKILSGPPTGFSSSAAGVAHTITLDVIALIGETNTPTVAVRLTPTGEVGPIQGTPVVSNVFALSNDDPPTLSIVQPSTTAYDVVVSYVIANGEASDHVQVTSLRWNHLDDGTSGPMTIRGGQGLGTAPFSVGGTRSSTIWDSLTDLGYGNDHLVSVSVSVTDGSSSVSATTGPFFVNNGPLSAQRLVQATTMEGMAVGDVLGDGRSALVSTFTSDTPKAGGAIVVNQNTGRAFSPAVLRAAPALPGTFPATPSDAANPFLYAFAHPSECAVLDVNGDGSPDLVAASSYFAPETSAHTLASNLSRVLGFVGEDTANGYSHVIAHQVSIRALQSSGTLDVADATFESTQAAVTARAPELFVSGSSQFPAVANGDPGHDNTGWLVQAVVAADLDGPGTEGRGSADVVFVEGLRDVTAALGGDARGAVVLRQVDPTTNQLGPTVALDPTDMGTLPTHAAVADVLSSSRTSAGLQGLGFTAPLGSPDIVVANSGDSSLTFYLQVAPATWSEGSYTAPTFTSVHVSLATWIPGIPAGDTVAVALGDLTGDHANDLVVIGQLSKTAAILVWDPTGPIAQATNGLVPYRLGPVLRLPAILAGRPAIADVTGDGRNDLLIPSGLTNSLLVFANTGNDAAGDPTFSLVPFPVGFGAWGAVAMDLNGDGRADAVVPNSLTAAFSVFYQVTAGTLYEEFTPIASGGGPAQLTVAQVDGAPALLVPCEAGNEVRVYATDPVAFLKPIATVPTGTPATGVTASLPLSCSLLKLGGTTPRSEIVIFPEIVVDSGGLGGGFELLGASPLATAVGAYGKLAAPSTGGDAGPLGAGGLAAVVLTSASANMIAVFEQQPDGSFASSTPLSGITIPRKPKIVDLDGDGYADLVVTCSNAIAVFYGSASGLASSAVLYPTDGVVDPVVLQVGDLNSDGLPDIACFGFATYSGGAVLYQTAPRVFTVTPILVGNEPGAVAIGDLDGDGRNDLAVCWGSDDLVAIYYQDAAKQGTTASLKAPVTYATGNIPFGCAILDVSGDGKNDLVVAARGANSLDVFIQR